MGITGEARFIGWGGGAKKAILHATEYAVLAGGHEAAIDAAFLGRMSDLPRDLLAYREFTRLVNAMMTQHYGGTYDELVTAARGKVATGHVGAPMEPAKPDVKRGADLKAVDGRVGIYSYTTAEGVETFAAKWPDPSKQSGTATKRGFATLEAAVQHRAEQTNPQEVAA